MVYCLRYKSLLLWELVLTGTGKWLHSSENLCRCQSWEIFMELPSSQACSKTRFCVIFTDTTSTSLLFLSLLPKKLKPKHQPHLCLKTHFYNEHNETATELQRWHASYQLFLPSYGGSGADGTANRVLTRNILQPHRGSHPSHPCALVTIVTTWPSRP